STPTTLPALLADLRAARKSGVAFDREEHTVGISAAGVALRDLLGNYVAISVPVPTPRFKDHQARIASRLLATKRAIESHLVAAEAAEGIDRHSIQSVPSFGTTTLWGTRRTPSLNRIPHAPFTETLNTA